MEIEIRQLCKTRVRFRGRQGARRKGQPQTRQVRQIGRWAQNKAVVGWSKVNLWRADNTSTFRFLGGSWFLSVRDAQ
ncbi:MAG: hypothetical protein A2Z03_11545 [Chloroflexi bacterium RBG_16_56_8]|nr:MAG: hypothetical protein A2Z03_11545 [Chloroflexi bacterium RBG_16_56_8]